MTTSVVLYQASATALPVIYLGNLLITLRASKLDPVTRYVLSVGYALFFLFGEVVSIQVLAKDDPTSNTRLYVELALFSGLFASLSYGVLQAPIGTSKWLDRHSTWMVFGAWLATTTVFVAALAVTGF